MGGRITGVGLVASVVLFFPWVQPGFTTSAFAASQAAGQVPGEGAGTRVVRVVAGANGVQAGDQFTVQDPRTVFSRAADTEAIVYFDWEGHPGKHRFEGIWRNPSGEIEVITRFEFEAKQRNFGGFWKLPLNPGMAIGLWRLEARVDGELAGSQAIEIREETGTPTPRDRPTVKKPLTPDEAYLLLRQQVFRIEGLDAGGAPVTGGMGVMLPNVGLATAFQAVDGASTIRVTAPDGRTTTGGDLVAWKRDEDIAVLPTPAEGVPVTMLATQATRRVGDRVYTLAVAADQMLTLVDTTITGQGRGHDQVERVTLAHPATRGAAGAPVLNDVGEVIGLLGGVAVPGAGTLRPTPTTTLRELLGYPDFGLVCIPISATAIDRTTPTTLAELLRRGIFTPPLDMERRHVTSGFATQSVKREASGWLRAVGQDTAFSRTAGPFAVVVYLSAESKLRTTGTFRLYHRDGRLLGESRPAKVSLNVGQVSSLSWPVDPSPLQVGIHRVDFLLNDMPVWRVFVEIQP